MAGTSQRWGEGDTIRGSSDVPEACRPPAPDTELPESAQASRTCWGELGQSSGHSPPPCIEKFRIGRSLGTLFPFGICQQENPPLGGM